MIRYIKDYETPHQAIGDLDVQLYVKCGECSNTYDAFADDEEFVLWDAIKDNSRFPVSTICSHCGSENIVTDICGFG